jgi:hypothetical protein
VYSPRFSTGYFPQRNRFTVLVETHSWKDYPTRVRVTRNTIIALTQLVRAHGARWRERALQADARASQLEGKPVDLDYATGWREPTNRLTAADDAAGGDPHVETIEFRGYAYTREPSPISGEPVTVYDPSAPQIWRVPFRRNTTPSLIVQAPRAGYVVSAGHAHEIGERLACHGIAFETLRAPMQDKQVDCFRIERADFAPTPFEGRQRVALHGAWRSERQDVAAGALFVPIAQPLARLVMALLEPQAPDSFAAWGFFNAWLEQKEYLEPYVIEIIAQDMMSRDARLAREFERKLADDQAFAADPNARREFFARRHPSWDQRFNLYPVFRLEKAR